MRTRTRTRRALAGALVTAGLLVASAVPASAAAPQVTTWTHHAVDPDYFECNGQPIDGVWDTSHRLTVFFTNGGVPVRDVEDMTFVGEFVNPANGKSIADSGQAIFFDTLDANGNFLTTMMNSVRHSRYFRVAGRDDFQSGAHYGVNRWDAGVAAACSALGA